MPSSCCSWEQRTNKDFAPFPYPQTRARWLLSLMLPWAIKTVLSSNRRLTRIPHEHCIISINFLQFLYVVQSNMELHIFTMFTKGQSIRHHFLQYFGNKYRLLSESTLTYSLPKTLNLTPPELMRNPGKGVNTIEE